MSEPGKLSDRLVFVLRWIAGLATIGWTASFLTVVWLDEFSTPTETKQQLWRCAVTCLVLFAGSISGIIAIRFGDRHGSL